MWALSEDTVSGSRALATAACQADCIGLETRDSTPTTSFHAHREPSGQNLASRRVGLSVQREGMIC